MPVIHEAKGMDQIRRGKRRALVVSIGFALFGSIVWALSKPGSENASPHAFFYLVLCLNTFFSICYFSKIGVPSRQWRIFDAMLALNYLFLALSIGLPVRFEALAAVLFGLASVKYVLQNSRMHRQDLKRKILIDLLGSALCLTSLSVTLLGHPLQSAWGLAIIFAAANVYLLIIRPMYKDNEIL